VPELDDIWIACAQKLGVRVARGGDAYVHYDGAVLHLATAEHLDADDTIAQLILHELCHWAVQGHAACFVADWGLDNTNDGDATRERAAVRLQAHLNAAWGLRAHLYPTTSVRAFYDSLGAAPLTDRPDDSIALADAGAERVAREPFAVALRDAFAASATVVGVAMHRAGAPLGVGACGTCVWRAPSGLCRRAGARVFVRADEVACARHEAALDCLTCGACCRAGYDAVLVGPREAIVARQPQLVVLDGTTHLLRRRGDRCDALSGEPRGPYACAVYADRPRACSDLERGGRHCHTARNRVGLSV
jgi:hypothetical protein